ncbi:MAG: Ribosome biogenesis protein 1 [Paramarteilia canceri]
MIVENRIDQSASETSDEEDVINTIGNVPLEWYKNYDHIGYDVSGKKVSQLSSNKIDQLIDRVGNPDTWKTIIDEYNGRKITLSDEIISSIQNISAGKDANGTIDLNSFLSKAPLETVSFDPKTSDIDKQRSLNSASGYVFKILKSLLKKKLENKPQKQPSKALYDIWNQPFEQSRYLKRRKQLLPPERFIPGHCESYNPPEEYLFTEKEKEQWNKNYPIMSKFSCIPEKHESMMSLSCNSDYLKFISNRCTNLFGAPRMKIKKFDANTQSTNKKKQFTLPKDLCQHPQQEKIQYYGHKGPINDVDISKNGVWLASCSSDKTISIWNILTGRRIHSFDLENEATSIKWVPRDNTSIISYTM